MGRRLLLILISFVLLTACASSAQIAQQGVAAEQAAQAQDEARCSSFGYQPGTPDYSHCLQAMYTQDQQQITAQQAQQAAAWDQLGNRLQRAGSALEAVGQPPPPPIVQPMPALQPVQPPPIRQPTQCNFIGNSMTCY